jgi:DNA (cytosine-5)-methyltransferase 1
MFKENIRFIDLFAGIGGFHQAVTNIFPNAKCVWASEINAPTAAVYTENFGIDAFCDITKVNESEIPQFDLLCAGFPCQPFSKGGNQKGFDDIRGTLFFDIIRILEYHKPKYVILENVSNFITHDNGNTYRVIIKSLQKLGYHMPRIPVKISPIQIGMPIQRQRLFIPAIMGDKSLIEFELPPHYLINKNNRPHVKSVFEFDKRINDISLKLTEYELYVLKIWNEFRKGVKVKTIGFPVWYDFFHYSGDYEEFPKWKQDFIKKNVQLYKENKLFIDNWKLKYNNLEKVNKTHRKFEWQCGNDIKSLFDCIIQFRPSGIRVKRPNSFSTLVAMNHTQIIGWKKRRLTMNELKKLQGFPDDFVLSTNKFMSLKQLGNAVNVKVVEELLNLVFTHDRK